MTVVETNAHSVADRTKELADTLQERFDQEVDDTVRQAERKAKADAPVRSGTLRGNVDGDISEDALINKTDYAIYVEMGTVHQPPNPFHRRAAIQAFRDSIKRIEKWDY
jgi:HK97 gp10 family phage protein